MTARTAANSPISTVQSGPAGGVVGAIYVAELQKKNKLITMDIGGTQLGCLRYRERAGKRGSSVRC